MLAFVFPATSRDYVLTMPSFPFSYTGTGEYRPLFGVKLLCFTGSVPCPCHEGIRVECKCSSTQSYPHHLLSGQLQAQAALAPGEALLLPIEWEAGWVPQLVWTFLRRQQNCFPCQESNRNFWVVQAVA